MKLIKKFSSTTGHCTNETNYHNFLTENKHSFSKVAKIRWLNLRPDWPDSDLWELPLACEIWLIPNTANIMDSRNSFPPLITLSSTNPRKKCVFSIILLRQTKIFKTYLR